MFNKINFNVVFIGFFGVKTVNNAVEWLILNLWVVWYRGNMDFYQVFFHKPFILLSCCFSIAY